jgi:hypothetical protein
MSGFSTPKKSKTSKKDNSISPEKHTGETRAKISEYHNIPQEPFVRMNKPSDGNPFASQLNIDEESTIRVNRQPSRYLLPSRRRQTQSVHLTKEEREFEKAKEAYINMLEKLDNPRYNIHSDPDYETFTTWANTIKGDTDMKKGLTIKKVNNDQPTRAELKYITKITPYLIAYQIHCNKFSSKEEEVDKCKKMYRKIKGLIDKFRDNGIKFFRRDRPNKEIIYMPHFPIKTTKKAHSLSDVEKSKSKSMKNKKAPPYSIGGKQRKTLKNRK